MRFEVLLVLGLLSGCAEAKKRPTMAEQRVACAEFIKLDADVKAKGGAVSREVKQRHLDLSLKCQQFLH